MAETKTAEGATDRARAGAEKPPRTQVGAKAPRGTGRRVSKRKAVEQKVRSYYEAMDNRDAPAMADHWRQDGVEDIVAVGILRGQDELREYFKDLFAALPDARTTITRLVAGDQSCAVEWRLEGTHSGAPLMDIEPTGKRIEIRGLDLFELEDGELVSNTAYFDGMSIARQIGMLPADGSGADRAMRSAFNAVTKLRKAVAERRTGG